jgi:DNA-binding response OmpR family regulator
MNDKKTHKILVVENDRTLSAALRDTLSAEGYEVTVTASGEEGLEIAEKERPDLMILDLMLEQITGIDVLIKIREDKEWGDKIKIIVLTGVTYLTNMEEVKRLSTKFISKSDFEMSALIDQIKKLLV